MTNRLYNLLFPLLNTLRAILSPVSFGVQGLVEQGGKLVLVRHSYTTGWHLPGGGVKRGEPPAQALLRELGEEIGLTRSGTPELLCLHSRLVWWTTNIIALYRVTDAAFDFKPNLEIREIVLADPSAPPAGTTRRALHQLAHYTAMRGQAPSS